MTHSKRMGRIWEKAMEIEELKRHLEEVKNKKKQKAREQVKELESQLWKQ